MLFQGQRLIGKAKKKKKKKKKKNTHTKKQVSVYGNEDKSCPW